MQLLVKPSLKKNSNGPIHIHQGSQRNIKIYIYIYIFNMHLNMPWKLKRTIILFNFIEKSITLIKAITKKAVINNKNIIN